MVLTKNEIKPYLIKYHPDNPETGDLKLYLRYHKLYKEFDDRSGLDSIERLILSLVESCPGVTFIEIYPRFEFSEAKIRSRINKLERFGMLHSFLTKSLNTRMRNGVMHSFAYHRKRIIYPGPNPKLLRAA